MSDPLLITVEQAREIVESERENKGLPRPELLQDVRQDARFQAFLRPLLMIREAHGQLIDVVATGLYSVRGRFILELIQNIEDCGFGHTDNPSVQFEVSSQSVIVTSNQDGFNERDVRQLCSTGNSWKRGVRGYVGEKGIGFKSVFQIASRVDIQSNAFSFHFEYNGGTSGEEKLGMITPILGNNPIPRIQYPLTIMTLHIRDNISYAELYSDFEAIPETLLLFLTKVQEISFQIHDPGEEQIITNKYQRSTESDEVISISKTRVGRRVRTATWRYRVTRINIQELENDSARPGINECESMLAFPIDENGYPKDNLGNDIYAFLPVCLVGFNFLLQADFILQANRQEVVVDSPWNMSIIHHVAEAFCNTMIQFSKLGPLRFTWMRYLPVGRAFASNQLWRSLSQTIRERLKEQPILYFHDPEDTYSEESLTTPLNVRVVPQELLDQDGLPLFTDRPSRNRRYLSLRYAQSDVRILQETFGLQDIEDMHMYHRIKQDLSSPNSKLKNTTTPPEWHTRAAILITRICRSSPGLKRMVESELDLIPLVDGSWVIPATLDVYFPSRSGPTLPPDLARTICLQADNNLARRKLFSLLGVTNCDPAKTIDLLWAIYTPGNGQEISLALSRMHLQYLYWHHQQVQDPRFRLLWLYSENHSRISCHNSVIYLPSNDELGPTELLRAVPNPHNSAMAVPTCNVAFLNILYMDAFGPDIRMHDISWLEWLEHVMNVRRILRLTYDAGSLSLEFRHVLQFRPEKIVQLLHRNWSVYRRQLVRGSRNEREIKQANVTCQDNTLASLSTTYFPSRSLIEKSQDVRNPPTFPFIALPETDEHDMDDDDWRFLRRFDVEFDPSICFFLESLRHHSRYPYETLSRAVKEGILRCYEYISDSCNELNKPLIMQTFERENLILHPSSFQSNSINWVVSGDCLWRAPENVLEKVALASAASYRSNQSVKRLFCEILGVKNATWRDYLSLICIIRQRPTASGISEQVNSLYKHLARSTMTDEDKAELLSTFELHALVNITDHPFWVSPSHCLWSSPVPLPGKNTLESMYSADLRSFFGDFLKISPAALATMVEGLQSLAQSRPSITAVKNLLFAINAENPERSDLLPLDAFNILPVSRLQQGSAVVSLQNRTSNFAVVDRTKLSGIFRSSTAFLDFSLDEVRQLNPLLQSLNLNDKFLSRICEERTACSEAGVLDHTLTEDFQARAFYLVRCAVSHLSPLVQGNPTALYGRLSQVTIRKTSGLSTQFTLRYRNGETVGPITQNTGHVHIQSEGDTWQIYVPLDSKQREICYRGNLPQSLAKLFKVEEAALMSTFNKVLNASIEVIDDLLEQDGVANIPGLEAPPRIVVPEAQQDDDGELGEGFEIISASANSSSARHQSRWNLAEQFQVQRNGSSGPQIRQERPLQESYHILLDNVKRIASQIDFRSRHDRTERAGNEFVPDFDHDAAFGSRSQGQMNHDFKIGAAGELFVYECLRRKGLPNFDWENWTSTIKSYILSHPDYVGRGRWPGRNEESDLQYVDHTGFFTRWLIEAGYLDQITWRNSTPEYLFEVKTTTGILGDRFFMSSTQVRLMESLALRPGHVSHRVYVIFRVYNLGRENMNVKIYVDPQSHRGIDLTFAEATYTVTPVG